MIQQQHPITPTPQLRRLWAQEAQRINPNDPVEWMQWVSEKAAQWGADQELEACCAYLVRCAQWEPEDVDELRAARRPKPPSLKEQALDVLKRLPIDPESGYCPSELNTIRRALEQLPDHG